MGGKREGEVREGGGEGETDGDLRAAVTPGLEQVGIEARPTPHIH